MKAVFLDLDGVLAIKSNDINKKGGVWKLNDTKQGMFKQILDSTDAKIVLSSSWRQVNLELTKKYLEEEGFWFNDYLIDITPTLERYKFSMPILRGVEIQYWLNTQTFNISNYLILDDNNDMLKSQQNNFIHTNTYIGLSIKNVIDSISILNS